MTTEAAPKKGLSTLAWVAIGCGGLIIVGLIAVFGLGFFAFQKGKEIVTEATGSDSIQEWVEDMQDNPAKTAAETMIRVNPDLEIVSTDDEAGTITFVDTRSGEEATLNFEDIAEGRFSVTTDEGDFTLDTNTEGEGGVTLTGPDGETRYGASADLSDVPDWVPVHPDGSNAQSLMYSATTSGGVTGAFTYQVDAAAEKVAGFYKSAFESGDYKVTAESMTRSGEDVFAGINGELGDGRSINVGIIEQGGVSQVNVNYNVKQ